MKKFYFLFLFALIASISNLYAAEKTVTWNFDEFPGNGLKADGFVTYVLSGEKCASTGGKASANIVTVNKYVNITNISFKISKTSDNKKTSVYKVYISENGKSWTNVGASPNYTDDKGIVKGKWTDVSLDFSTDADKKTGYVKIEYTGSTAVRLIDAISITYEEAEGPTPVVSKCATPTFTPAAGFLKLGNAITFTSATADAEVYYQYSYNGGEYNSFVKGTSFTPDKEGTYKIIAKATKTGLEDGVSEEQIYEVGNLVFYESFDKNDGTGGNDGQWSGNIATNEIQYDVAGWTCENEKGANKCAKFGASTKGKATTPALTGLGGDAVLTFKAGAWNIEKEKTTLNISITNGTLDKTSVDLKKGEFTEYTINITGADATSKITFEAAVDKNNRFFLDEVKVKQVAVATPTITPNGGDVKVGDKITFATKTDGATLSYSTDGGQTWTPGSEYTATTVGALNLWVKATKGSDESAVAKATFNVVDPNAIGSLPIRLQRQVNYSAR